jgi:DNA helicase-2/ATP-dependent DNA helicase PcrA
MQLDQNQLTAAHADPDRPLVVIAGPGSGKTRLLTERIALLLAHQQAGGLPPGSIVTLTFTQNAARELNERLHSRLGERHGDGAHVRTFHSFGLALLRSGWAREYLGLDCFRVATQGQVRQAAVDALTGAGLDMPRWAAPRLIAAAKLGRMPPVDDAARVHAARLRYDAWLRARQLIDVQDMIVLPVEILRRHQAARADVQRRVAHVLSDEAQDWTAYQAAFLAYAAGPAGRLTAVGDHRQAIFSRSSPRYLLELPLAFKDTQTIALARTYRLHCAVLAVANAVAAHIADGATPLEPDHCDGPRPVLHIARSAEAEADWIARVVHTLVGKGELTCWRDAAVLARTRVQRDRLARSLRAAGVPCHVRAATFIQKPAVAAIMAWLALLRDGNDSGALLRAIEAPPRGYLREPPHGLRDALAATGPWTMERLHRACPPGLSNGQQRALGQFVRLYHGLAYLLARAAPTVAFDALLERTGLREWLVASYEAAGDDIAALRDLVAEEGDIGALQHLLGEEVSDAHQDAVQVSTVHGFKGHEAEAVFIAGLDEGWFPHPQALGAGPEGLQAEIRAFYVALTRARRLLYLSSACTAPDASPQRQPSRFLQMIPAEFLRMA